MSNGFKVVIPARYESTRLPGKPLLKIAGKPMIEHVCARAQEANADEIVVATDDQRIFEAVSELGIRAVMTRSDHQSGTERIEEVAKVCGWLSSDIIVNLQGDEPLIPAAYIQDVAAALGSQEQAGVATLAAQIDTVEELFNPNAVKVVLNEQNYALYFSRAPIPWHRDQFSRSRDHLPTGSVYLRHIGMYAYTVAFLEKYYLWERSPLESIESLEQLRILWHGASILVQTVAKVPEAGVDTLEDLKRVEKALQC